MRMASPLRQQVKFMDVSRLKYLEVHPEETDRVQAELSRFITMEQRNVLFGQIINAITTRGQQGYTFDSGGESYQVLAPGARPSYVKEGLQFDAGATPIQVLRKQLTGRSRTYPPGRSASPPNSRTSTPGWSSPWT